VGARRGSIGEQAKFEKLQAFLGEELTKVVRKGVPASCKLGRL